MNEKMPKSPWAVEPGNYEREREDFRRETLELIYGQILKRKEELQIKCETSRELDGTLQFVADVNDMERLFNEIRTIVDGANEYAKSKKKDLTFKVSEGDQYIVVSSE